METNNEQQKKLDDFGDPVEAETLDAFGELVKLYQREAVTKFCDMLIEASKHCLFYNMLAAGDVKAVYNEVLEIIEKGDINK